MDSQLGIKILEARKARLIRKKILQHKRRFKLLKSIKERYNSGNKPASCCPSFNVTQ
jgi:hypothetical protein